MMSFFRQSQGIITRAAIISRAASTTGTAGGSGTKVQPSGASQNLSQTSRAADGTDMAMRDAKQRTATTDPMQSKSTSGSSQTPPPAGKSSTPWGTVVLGLGLAAGSYYVYKNYIQSSNIHKDAHGQPSTGRDGSGGKKH